MVKHRYRLSNLPNMTKTPYFPIFSIVFYSKTMKNLRIQSFWWRHAFQTLKICTVDPHSHRNLWAKGHWFPPNWTLNSFSRPSRKVVHLTALHQRFLVIALHWIAIIHEIALLYSVIKKYYDNIFLFYNGLIRKVIWKQFHNNISTIRYIL